MLAALIFALARVMRACIVGLFDQEPGGDRRCRQPTHRAEGQRDRVGSGYGGETAGEDQPETFVGDVGVVEDRCEFVLVCARGLDEVRSLASPTAARRSRSMARWRAVVTIQRGR